jgi:hypothetical protein
MILILCFFYLMHVLCLAGRMEMVVVNTVALTAVGSTLTSHEFGK